MSVESIPEDEEEAETSTSTNSEKVGHTLMAKGALSWLERRSSS